MNEKLWGRGMGTRCCSIVVCVFLILVGSQSVLAHGGGLNAQGCHKERATGECHCHRDEHGKKLSPPVRCEKFFPEHNKPKDKPKDDNRSEMDFVAKFCHARGGQIEKSLRNRRRADCITEKHAIEGDFASKWNEAYYQSQHYAIDADKKAGILLILKNDNDEVYIRKLCDLIAEKQDSIDVFAIGHGFAKQGESVSCPYGKQMATLKQRLIPS